MKLQKVELAGFMTHQNTTLDLPPTGVILFTGNNGAGKSSIAEAIAFGRWGKTLRGKSPWAGTEGHVIHTYDDGTTISRVLKKSKQELRFNLGAEAVKKYENLTKAQEALEQVIGPWNLWRKSAVFSAADAASFTTATDGERKRLIEELLGIDKFDAALKAARADLSVANQRVLHLERDVKLYAERVASADQRVADATAALALSGGDVDVAALTREKDRLDGLLTGCARDARKAAQFIAEAVAMQNKIEGEKGRIWERLSRLGAATCPSCEQAISAEMKEKASTETRGRLDALKVAEEETAEARREAEADAEDIEQDTRGIVAKLDPVRDQLRTYAANERARTLASSTRQTALAAREDAEEALDSARADLQTFRAKAATLAAVERVLGLKGVRAHLLGDALTGLQDATNAWLPRLAGAGLSLVLNAYSESASTAAVADKIAFDVQGAGNGHGYFGASGGERRRLDIGIMLAFGDMAAAAHAQAQDLVVFDEVFDTLDKDGVEAIVEVMKELSADRLCVVISHSDEVVQALPVAAHYVVAAGQLNRVR